MWLSYSILTLEGLAVYISFQGHSPHHSSLNINLRIYQLSGLVVRMPACCAEGGGSNPGLGAQDFQYRLSSAETQQPVDRMRRKARGCLVLSVLC